MNDIQKQLAEALEAVLLWGTNTDYRNAHVAVKKARAALNAYCQQEVRKPLTERREIGEICNEWGDPEAFAERSCEITGRINDLPFGTKVYVDVPITAHGIKGE